VTHKFAKHLILAVSVVAFTAMAANATEACNTGEVPVTAPPADSGPALVCTLGNLTFSWEELSYSPTAGSLDIVTPFTTISGDDYILDFQFSGAPATDVLMTYEVSSTSDNITGVDSSFTSADTAPPSGIVESVCSVDPGLYGGACPTPDTLASYTNPPNTSASFGAEQNVWITKDIQTGGPVAISTFTDSVVETPEPSSLGLLFLAAFGIAASARKLRKA
jgi:hypothetical protein